MRLDDMHLERLLPDSITDDVRLDAAARALNDVLSQSAKDTRHVKHLPRLDDLPSLVLDLLAWQFDVKFYEPLHLADDVKRALIRRSVDWHRHLGTRQAVEDLCNIFFTNSRVEEWFEYGSDPFLFQITIDNPTDAFDFTTFKRMLNVAKNARSHLERIILHYHEDIPLVHGIGRFFIGNIRLKHSQPSKIVSHVKTGIARCEMGSRRLRHSPLPPLSTKWNVGIGRLRSGRIRRGKTHPPQPPRRFIALHLYHGVGRARTGHIYLKNEPDEEFPLGRHAWFRFRGDDGHKRSFKVLNVRGDLTEAELRDFAWWVVSNQILLNSKGRPLKTPVKVSIVERHYKKIL